MSREIAKVATKTSMLSPQFHAKNVQFLFILVVYQKMVFVNFVSDALILRNRGEEQKEHKNFNAKIC
jgi:hypothetical protein